MHLYVSSIHIISGSCRYWLFPHNNQTSMIHFVSEYPTIQMQVSFVFRPKTQDEKPSDLAMALLWDLNFYLHGGNRQSVLWRLKTDLSWQWWLIIQFKEMALGDRNRWLCLGLWIVSEMFSGKGNDKACQKYLIFAIQMAHQWPTDSVNLAWLGEPKLRLGQTRFAFGMLHNGPYW